MKDASIPKAICMCLSMVLNLSSWIELGGTGLNVGYLFLFLLFHDLDLLRG